MEAWRGISPSALSKEWQRERRCLFIISVGAGKFWKCEGFCPILPKLAEKFFVQLCLQIFSHKDHEDLFLV